MSLFHSFRLGTYFVILVLLVLTAFWLKPQYTFFPPLETWSMILGYLAYVCIGLTLLIGPIRSWLPARRTAFCKHLRRDLGILAGLAALLHVVLVLVLFSGEHHLILLNGGDEAADGIWGMFFHRNETMTYFLYPNTTLIGVANYLGLTAFLILLCLWLTSSDKATEWLEAPTWKRLHLANPFLFVLVVFHSMIYIQSVKGHPHTFSDILWLAATVLVMRIISFVRTVWARQK